MITISSEHTYSECKLERKFQDKISPYNKIFEWTEEESIEFKVEQQMEPNKFSSEHIKNEVLTFTSETLSSEDCIQTKLQTKLDIYDKISEQPEEEFMYFIEQHNQEWEQTEEELVTLNLKIYCLSEYTKSINEISVNIP